MRYLILLLVAITISCGQTVKKVDADAAVEKTVVNTGIAKVVLAQEFKTIIQGDDVQLIDVRTPEEYAAGKIAHAKNINFFDSDFKAQIAKLDTEYPVAIYCQSGRRSGKATKLLKKLGFTTVYDLKGGYTLWGATVQ